MLYIYATIITRSGFGLLSIILTVFMKSAEVGVYSDSLIMLVVLNNYMEGSGSATIK